MDQINDGDMQIGSRVLTINSISYATDNFQFGGTSSTRTIRTDGQNRPTGRHVAKGETQGSATLQLAESDTPLPEFGDTFTEAEGEFYIDEVPERVETKGGEVKVNIKFSLAITDDVVIS